MQDEVMNERTIELIIIKAFDKLTIEEENEFSNILQNSAYREVIQTLINDKDKLIEFVCEYTKSSVERDDNKLELAKKEFDKQISKMK